MAGDGVALGADSTGKKIRTQSRLHTRVWTAATPVTVGEFFRPTVANTHVYRVDSISGTGTTHATTEPTWPLTSGTTVTDNAGANQVIWKEFGSDFFHEQYTIITDETTGNAARVLSALPASTDYGMATRPVPLARTQRSLSSAPATATTFSATTETLLNLVSVLGGTAGSSASAFTVTTGKTFRIQGIFIATRAVTATANYVRFSLRLNTGGAAITTSPVIAQGTCPAVAAVIGTGSVTPITIPDGLELSSTWGFAISVFSSGANTAITPDACIIGYEY